MRRLGDWLGEKPIRLIELGSAVVLLAAALSPSDTLARAAFYYSLAALLPILLHPFLNGDGPR